MSQYVPKISKTSLCRLQRIAWAINRPMTKTLDSFVEFIARHINQQAVCNACLDSSQCDTCGLDIMIKANRRAVKPCKGRIFINLSDLP
jgi:hypothetical protein